MVNADGECAVNKSVLGKTDMGLQRIDNADSSSQNHKIIAYSKRLIVFLAAAFCIVTLSSNFVPVAFAAGTDFGDLECSGGINEIIDRYEQHQAKSDDPSSLKTIEDLYGVEAARQATEWMRQSHWWPVTVFWSCRGHALTWSDDGHRTSMSRNWSNNGHGYHWTRDGHATAVTHQWGNEGHSYVWTRDGHDTEVSQQELDQSLNKAVAWHTYYYQN